LVCTKQQALDWISDSFQTPIIFGSINKTINLLDSDGDPIDIRWMSETENGDPNPEGLFEFTINSELKDI